MLSGVQQQQAAATARDGPFQGKRDIVWLVCYRTVPYLIYFSIYLPKVYGKYNSPIYWLPQPQSLRSIPEQAESGPVAWILSRNRSFIGRRNVVGWPGEFSRKRKWNLGRDETHGWRTSGVESISGLYIFCHWVPWLWTLDIILLIVYHTTLSVLICWFIFWLLLWSFSSGINHSVWQYPPGGNYHRYGIYRQRAP